MNDPNAKIDHSKLLMDVVSEVRQQAEHARRRGIADTVVLVHDLRDETARRLADPTRHNPDYEDMAAAAEGLDVAPVAMIVATRRGVPAARGAQPRAGWGDRRGLSRRRRRHRGGRGRHPARGDTPLPRLT